jgi:vacuolar protein sorting-associated protein 54
MSELVSHKEQDDLQEKDKDENEITIQPPLSQDHTTSGINGGIPLDFSDDEFAGVRGNRSQQHQKEQQKEQQQQQQSRSIESLPNQPLAPPNQSRDHHAMEMKQQAQQVLEATNHNLDGFNLLGVVANPRGPHFHHHNPYSSNSSSGISQRRPAVMTTMSHTTNNNNGNHTPSTGEYGSGLEDTMLALESTLAGVTEQIDAINFVVDQWSRQYLGTLYYYDNHDDLEYRPPVGEHDVMAAQITELPHELATLSLQSVQDYLTQTGVLAHALDERRYYQQQQHDDEDQQRRDSRSKSHHHEWHETIAPNSLEGDLVDQNEEDFMLELEERIPSRFFETYFDLTDRNTFSELLVLEEHADMTAATTANDVASSGHAGTSATKSSHHHHHNMASSKKPEDLITDGSNFVQQLPPCLSESTHDILRLPPPDAFSTYLDKVEIALLQQVRNKSIAFFHETNRFGQLKEWITGLVEEVERVRELLSSVADKSVVAWELIPLLDKQRQDLVSLNRVLESAHDVIRCKSSISGLLSANDDLGAAEQIQYGRTLLQQEHLHKLVALKTVHDQLTQYETLVVANLGEELVEILLDWNSFSKTSAFSRIPDMVRGLQLCQALDKVAQLYSSRLLDVIRMTVRTTVGEFAEEADSSVKTCVTSMTLERFADCLDMLFEQLLDILKSAVGVQQFGNDEAVDFSASTILTSAAELSSKSISELLRLRKEAHSLVSLEEMRRLWDVCTQFTLELEKLSDYKATALRSTLLAQAKAFVERQHVSNMSSLVAALDSERWTQCDVSAERQGALTRLRSGRAVASTRRQGGIDKYR